MSGSVQYNGTRVISAEITMPYYGAWTADLVLAVADPIASSGSLVIGDLTLHGTVHREAPFGGGKSVRLVGGANGWRKELPARGYSHDFGITAATIMKDAADECGETIVVSRNASLGTGYAREAAKAERALHIFTDGKWWIDPDGVTQTKDRDSKIISSPFTVMSWSGGHGKFDIATEKLSDWLPGRTFTAPQVQGTHEISCSSVSIDKGGKMRVSVLNGSTTRNRIREDLRSMIRAETTSLTYAGIYEYTVAPSVGLGLVSTLDVVSTSSLVPDLTNVPIAPELGIVAAPLAGTTCRVRFVNCDPGRPEVCSLASTTEHTMTTEACALLIYNFMVSFFGGSLPPPISAIGAPLKALVTPAMIQALQMQSIPAPPGLIAQGILAATLTAGMATGQPSQTSAPFSAIIESAPNKTLDVSGLFPGLGIPHGN